MKISHKAIDLILKLLIIALLVVWGSYNVSNHLLLNAGNLAVLNDLSPSLSSRP